MIVFIRRTAPVIALLALAGALLVSPRPSSAATTTIPTGDLWFCNSSFEGGVCTTTITTGDTVTWDFSGATATHSSTSDSSMWDSGYEMPGGSFQFTFTQAGSFPYHCNIHPQQMKGVIVVQAAASPTSPPAAQTPAAGATQTPRSVPPGDILPKSGQGPQSATAGWWLLGALAVSGGAITSFGALAYARRPK